MDGLSKESTVDKDKKAKLSLGLALIILGALLIFGKPDRLVREALSTSFESEPVSVQGFAQEEGEEARVPDRVIIPSLSVDLVVEKADVVGGYWEVFEEKAGWGAGSGLPGQSGNQVIFAHAREGLFLPLRNVEEGMRVYVLTDEGNYAYEVEEIKEVFPNQTEVIEPTEDETLTLYTCSGFADTKRLIVVAKRI